MDFNTHREYIVFCLHHQTGYCLFWVIWRRICAKNRVLCWVYMGQGGGQSWSSCILETNIRVLSIFKRQFAKNVGAEISAKNQCSYSTIGFLKLAFTEIWLQTSRVDESFVVVTWHKMVMFFRSKILLAYT